MSMVLSATAESPQQPSPELLLYLAEFAPEEPDPVDLEATIACAEDDNDEDAAGSCTAEQGTSHDPG